MAYDTPNSCQLPSLDSCQKRFLWAHKDADLVQHPAIGLVHRVGDVEKFPQAIGLESLDPFQQAGSMSLINKTNYISYQ